FGVTAGGNAGKGKGNGNVTNYANSHVGSKDSQTILQSGNTTNIIGGQVQGKGVQVDAKELNIESLQNTANYNSTQQNIEGQVTIGIGTGVAASGSANKTNINANYASVQDQAGIYA
ncbi:hemagglutinin repeat-containing protein, partial [Escherichia coli]|uniref:hemagglutinin repeat-containing protein n=1 Tax=Escherichia coli TaxID=562 RepID=UPI001EDA39B0